MEDLGKVDFDAEKQKRNKPIFVPSWFTVDLKTGVSAASVCVFVSLSVMLTYRLFLLFLKYYPSLFMTQGKSDENIEQINDWWYVCVPRGNESVCACVCVSKVK